jgi:Type I phosphodiesterase / nucleotide pyrophosphatase
MTTLLATETPRIRLTDHSVILLEFNELCPTLITRFMEQGELPHFQRLYRDSQVYVTDAEESAPNLEPWIQWVTVHSGLSFAEHGVFHLGDGHNLNCKCLWDIASDHGLKVWVCGSMNIGYRQPINGWVLPDVWSTGCAPFPDELVPFYDFVRSQVQEHTNTEASHSKSALIRFLGFMLSHGLSSATVCAIAKQIVGERFTGNGRWKRATLQDKLQWDVFRSYYKKFRPNFSTFFLNSTAHFQHLHWRNMDPGPFRVKPADEEQLEFERAILYGYKQMDKIVRDALSMADEKTTLVLSSALGQQPCLLFEDTGGKVIYRPRDFAQVLEFAGITEPYRVAPVMAEQFHVHFDCTADASVAAERLRSVLVEGHPALLAEQDGASVFSGCRIWHRLSKEAQLQSPTCNRSVPFFELFYVTEGMKSGMHHPDGILWIRRTGVEPRVHAEKVPLLDVAPTILSLFAIPKPMWMRGSPLS